jgi:hypothetical protein
MAMIGVEQLRQFQRQRVKKFGMRSIRRLGAFMGRQSTVGDKPVFEAAQVGNYSVAPVANATNYTWTAPAGGSVSAGQGTNNATITFGTTTGTICVTAGNGCGTSLPSCLTVNVSASVLTVSTTITNATSSGACDGSATAVPAGGTGPYTYAWTGGGGTAATASGLCVGNYTVCVTDAGGCVTCSAITISSPTGVIQLTDNGSIKVFPNPANDYIVVQGEVSIAANLNVSVLNMFGQIVIQDAIQANGVFSKQINIEGIPTGVYFVRISSGDMIRNTRITKIQ